MPTTFGVWLRGVRKASGLSMEEVARRADITYSHVSRIESGRTVASRRTVFLLVKAIGGDMHEGLLAAGYVPGDLVFLSDPQTLRVAKAYSELPGVLKDRLEQILTLLPGTTDAVAASANADSPPELHGMLAPMERNHLRSHPFELTPEVEEALKALLTTEDEDEVPEASGRAEAIGRRSDPKRVTRG